MSSDQGTGGSAYWVTLYYREPTYEMQVGAKPEPYKWTYTIIASDPVEAQSEAVRQFDETTRLSNVGWVRRIVKIETQPAPPDTAVA